MVEYYYDAWGNHKWTGDETLAKRNPFRYRGYYYDEETGLYFLKSRYYDPKIGRFINIDSVCYIAPELLNGLNLYAYCLNNPVMYVDPYGTFLISIGATIALSTLGVLGIGAAVEIVFHPIEKTINNISNWVGDLYYDLNNIYSKSWEPGTWPGDDPTIPPDDGFVWRGPGEVGSDKGEWYNPLTGDQLHPDLFHKPPKGPHWGWRNKLRKILQDIFKNGGPPSLA